MRRWVGCFALTMMMAGCDLSDVCNEIDGLCTGGDDGGDDGADDGPPGDDGMGEDGWADEGWGGDDDPVDPCLEEFQWCIEEIGDESCDAILESCEPPGPPDPSPCDDAIDSCFVDADACFEAGGGEACDLGLMECIDAAAAECGGGDSGGDGGDGGDPCFEEYEWCLQEIGDESCEGILESCVPPGPPPGPSPCDDAVQACFEDVDGCYEAGGGQECDQALGDCLEATEAECGGGGEDGGDGGGPPVDPEFCFEEADACYAAEEDPQVCDELMLACLGEC